MNGQKDKITGKFVNNKNDWECVDGLLYCYLNGELLFFTDVPELMKYSWGKYANGYSSSVINGKKIQAHRFISKPTGTEIVDHINRNKKDNRRSNLRNTNKSINSFNTDRRRNNKSGHTGVYYRNDTKRWTAEIIKDGLKICLGCYGKYEQAVNAREEAERKYYGNK